MLARVREASSLPKLPRLSVRLHGGMTPALCVEQARAAEAAGIDAIWFAENPFARGIMAAAAACALATGHRASAPACSILMAAIRR